MIAVSEKLKVYIIVMLLKDVFQSNRLVHEIRTLRLTQANCYLVVMFLLELHAAKSVRIEQINS